MCMHSNYTSVFDNHDKRARSRCRGLLIQPTFKQKNIERTLHDLLDHHWKTIRQLLKQPCFSWDNLIEPIESLENELNLFWAPIRHLHAVADTPALRKTYARCLDKLTKYHTKLSHHKPLFDAIVSIADRYRFSALNADQQRVIALQIRDFKLAGVALPTPEKKRFAELSKRYSKLTTRYENNVLDATQDYYYHTKNGNELLGLPPQFIELAKQAARHKKKTGFVLTLDFPVYLAVMTYADNQSLRQTIYRAFTTRASDQKPCKPKYDNKILMDEILSIRYQMAILLGFQDYAEYAIQTKMAKSSKDVTAFLNQLLKRSMPFAKREIKALEKFAHKKLKPWDIAYYDEKLKHKLFDFNEESLRPYFQEPIVLQAMFDLVETLFNIKIKEKPIKDKWHKDVKFYEIYTVESTKHRSVPSHTFCIGGFYTDLYARQGKRGGAWMDECVQRRQLKNGKIQHPIAFLTCNFSSPVNKKPSLLTHSEILTLFHEFGHCLQHLLTQIDYIEISGINGVEWDAVELASQFMENFCWEKKVLDRMTRHVDTGKKLPKALFDQLIKSKHFQAGMHMIRQLQFALFDFELHQTYSFKAPKNHIQHTLNRIREKTSVMKMPRYHRFQNSFSHIFAGGYAAGYYSYKWAEVLSADAFSLFEEKGIFNKKTGQSFLKNILQQGGSQDAINLFQAFRGRKPNISALLKHSGLKKG